VARAVQEPPPVSRTVVHVVVPLIFMFLSTPAVSALAQQLEARPRPRDAAPVSPEPISNIRVDDVLEPLVSTLLAKSETFRRQWDIIRTSRFIRVTVVSRPGMQDPGSARARTEVSRYAYGAIRATIEIPSATDLPELLPHEFEHVVEQLEGLDLRDLARRHEGVFEVRKGVFETARARAAGLQVYREVYGETDAAVEAAFGGVRRAWRAMGLPQRPETASKTHEPGANRRPGSPAGPGAHLHKRW
jgi:hypothetical protein